MDRSNDCCVIFAGLGRDGGFQLFHNGIEVDKQNSSHILTFAQGQEFEAKVGKTFLTHDVSGNHILLVGVGDVQKLTMKDWLDVMATVGREAKKIHAKTVSIILEKEITETIGAEKTAEGIVEGMTLGTYAFNRYKKMEKKEHEIGTVTIFFDSARFPELKKSQFREPKSTNDSGNDKDADDIQAGIRLGELMSRGTIVARDLVNEPSSVTTPTFLSLVARDIARKNPSIICTIFEKKDMEKLGMGGILGIAKGSDEDPKLIQLQYQPERIPHSRNQRNSDSGNERVKTIVLVGKGVTFDSGGLSLKSQDGMETMKIDMAGAAAILGIFSVLSELKPHATVIGFIPAVENMPSGKAIKPGDVVKAYNGKTIEVISTDAEGRVILADALAYAGETIKPDAMIDMATLTGACMIALGEDITGLFSTNTQLAADIMRSSGVTGEAVWELPLTESYNDLLKSDVADIRNVTRKRYGGAITAALFLKAFVPDSVPWAHLDIAGPAIAEKDAPLTPVGGTGFGVRLIIEYLLT